jgi:hypothetical protein
VNFQILVSIPESLSGIAPQENENSTESGGRAKAGRPLSPGFREISDFLFLLADQAGADQEAGVEIATDEIGVRQDF